MPPVMSPICFTAAKLVGPGPTRPTPGYATDYIVYLIHILDPVISNVMWKNYNYEYCKNKHCTGGLKMVMWHYNSIWGKKCITYQFNVQLYYQP